MLPSDAHSNLLPQERGGRDMSGFEIFLRFHRSKKVLSKVFGIRFDRCFVLKSVYLHWLSEWQESGYRIVIILNKRNEIRIAFHTSYIGKRAVHSPQELSPRSEHFAAIMRIKNGTASRDDREMLVGFLTEEVVPPKF